MAAWTSPRTWVAGAVVTAAQLNAHLRDNLQALLPLDQVAWTSYTPTLTQSGAVTKTVTRAKYSQIGKIVVVSVYLDVTGAGTASNAITVSLPVTAASATTAPVGTGFIYDASATTAYNGTARIASTTTVAFYAGQTATASITAIGQTSSPMTAALANTDIVTFEATYEAA